MPRFHTEDWSRSFARTLRRRLSPAERLVWNVLRYDFEHKFRRQEPIGRYIADFVCFSHRLIVDVDGAQHIGSTHDEIRDAYLRSLGFDVLCITTLDIWEHLPEVKERIGRTLEERAQTLGRT